MALTSPVGFKTCAVCGGGNFLPHGRHINSICFLGWGTYLSKYVLSWDWLVDHSEIYEFHFLLVILFSFTAGSPEQERREAVTIIMGFKKKKTKTRNKQTNPTHTKHQVLGYRLPPSCWRSLFVLRLSSSHLWFKNHNITVHLLVCSTAGRCIQWSEHLFTYHFISCTWNLISHHLFITW